jgi:hypothetical protein
MRFTIGQRWSYWRTRPARVHATPETGSPLKATRRATKTAACARIEAKASGKRRV